MTLQVVQVVAGTSSTDKYVGPAPIVCSLAIPGTNSIWSKYVSTVDNLVLVSTADGSHLVTYPASSFSAGRVVPTGVDSDNNAYVPAPDGRIQKCLPGGGAIDYFIPTHDDGQTGIVIDGSTFWGISATDNSVARLTAIDYGAHTCTETLATGANRKFTRFAMNARGITGRLYGFGDSSPFPIRYIDTGTLTGTDIVSSCDGLTVVVGLDGNIYSTIRSGLDTILRQHDQDGTLLNSLTFTGEIRRCTLYDSDGFLWVSGDSGSLDFKKVDSTTMTVVATAAGMSYVNVIGEPAAGIPAVDLTSGNQALGIIFDPDVTVPLTSVSGAGSVGSLAPSRSLALTGNAGASAIGSMVAVGTLALTGLTATGSVGSLALSHTEALTGNSAVGSPGTLGVQINTNVTVALTGVAASGAAGTLTPTGGTYPQPPFGVQSLFDSPRNTSLKVAAAISVDFPQSVLADPVTLSSIQPGFPSGPKARGLAVERLTFNIPAGLQILLWWAAPVPALMIVLEGQDELVFTSQGFLQNPDPMQTGQILISSSGLSGTQSFALTIRLIKQGISG